VRTAEPIPLTSGTNTVNWLAANADYITSAPSCASSFTLAGPDIVLSYTPTTKQLVELELSKPSNTRWVAIVSAAACGTLTPQLSCSSDFTATSFGDSFVADANTTYYVYVRDTTSGTNCWTIR
jgi:hypothetical protein